MFRWEIWSTVQFLSSYLQRSLVRREGNKATPVRRELPQEAGGLLHIDHSEVGEKVLVEAAYSVPVSSGSARTDPAPLKTMNHILILNPSGLQGWGVLIHRGDQIELSNPSSKGSQTGGQYGDSTTSQVQSCYLCFLEKVRENKGTQFSSKTAVGAEGIGCPIYRFYVSDRAKRQNICWSDKVNWYIFYLACEW